MSLLPTDLADALPSASGSGAILDGRYRLERALGHGGMGVVYRGTQLSIDRPVAIKVIRDDLAHDHDTARRFLREARVLASLVHPNIVSVIDYAQNRVGTLYLVMELVAGRTLDDVIADGGAFSVERACAIAIQLCQALAAAHARGIVHRDLKPANIMLVEELGGLVKVLDFGLAKSFGRTDITTSQVTQAGLMIGTPMYMAPEAIGGDSLDPRSDLYSLGCVLFEMLSGKGPFANGNVETILVRQLHEPPPPLPAHVPAALTRLVGLLLAKLPEQRPATALEVRDELARILALPADGDDEMPTLVRGHYALGARPVAPTLSPADSRVELVRRRALAPEPLPRPTIRQLPPPPVPPPSIAVARPRRQTSILVISAVLLAVVFAAFLVTLALRM